MLLLLVRVEKAPARRDETHRHMTAADGEADKRHFKSPRKSNLQSEPVALEDSGAGGGYI